MCLKQHFKKNCVERPETGYLKVKLAFFKIFIPTVMGKLIVRGCCKKSPKLLYLFLRPRSQVLLDKKMQLTETNHRSTHLQNLQSDNGGKNTENRAFIFLYPISHLMFEPL
jgi:hypothetical protein